MSMKADILKEVLMPLVIIGNWWGKLSSAASSNLFCSLAVLFCQEGGGMFQSEDFIHQMYYN